CMRCSDVKHAGIPATIARESDESAMIGEENTVSRLSQAPAAPASSEAGNQVPLPQLDPAREAPSSPSSELTAELESISVALESAAPWEILQWTADRFGDGFAV